jgi:hypothetical protein
MLQVTSGVLDADRRKRFAQHLYQSVFRTGSCFAHHTLDLAERFLYRIEVWEADASVGSKRQSS